MIIYTNQKSNKKQSKNKKVLKQMEQEKQWLKSLESISKPSLVSKKSLVVTKRPNLSYVPIGRETPHHKSLESSGGVATKPVHTIHYTGDKIVGIGTLHKSNAVPVFTQEEAKDQANMRR
jgi:hypothetical protein